MATDSRGNSSERDRIPNKIKNIEQIDIFESQQSDSFLLPEIEKQTKENSQKINYKYNPEDKIGLGGLKTKYKNNLEAIKTLKVIEKENRIATAEEQIIICFSITASTG